MDFFYLLFIYYYYYFLFLGENLASFFFDPYARPGKLTGAWMEPGQGWWLIF